MVFDSGDGFEAAGDLVETLLGGYLGGVGVEFNAFDLLLVGCDLEVVERRGKHSGVDSDGSLRHRVGLLKIFQEDFGMVKFVGRCLVENIGVLEILFLLRRLGEKCVA